MEMSQIALNQGLTFLAWATGIVVIVVAGFLVKLLIDLSALAKNLNQTSIIVQKTIFLDVFSNFHSTLRR